MFLTAASWRAASCCSASLIASSSCRLRSASFLRSSIATIWECKASFAAPNVAPAILRGLGAWKDGPGRQRNDRLFLAPLKSGEEAGPADVLGLSERVRAELEDFFVWSTRWEKKELRFLGWKGIHEAETLLSKAERAARG